MREVHQLTLDGIEQTFVFDQVPGEGDLVVRLDVETDLDPEVDGERLRFLAGDLGHVELGRAFVIDGAGRRAPMTRDWVRGGIELRVPAAFLANATLPVTIDPVWTTSQVRSVSRTTLALTSRSRARRTSTSWFGRSARPSRTRTSTA